MSDDEDVAPAGDDSTPDEGDEGRAHEEPRVPAARVANESSVVVTLRNIDNAVGTLEQALLVLFLLILVGIGASQAVSTNLFHKSWLWSFELIRYMVFFIAMTGAALSAQTERLISMDFVTRKLRPMSCARVRQGLRAFTILVCVLVIISSGALAEVLAQEPKGHIIDADTGFYALPVGVGLIAFHLAMHMAIDLSYLLRGVCPPEDTEIHVH